MPIKFGLKNIVHAHVDDIEGAPANAALNLDARIKATQIEHVAIKRLKPNPRNAKKHPDRQIALLQDNCERFGVTQPMLSTRAMPSFAAMLVWRRREERTYTAFVDDMEIDSDDVLEQEADTLAQESLIPSSILEQVVWSHASGLDDITTVSARALVPVTVVAGRWQRDHQNYKKFSRLIDRSSVRSLLFTRNAAPST